MKIKELNSMSASELNGKLSEIEKELMKQNTQRAMGTQFKNPFIIKNLKKDRARILYLLSLKEKGGSKKA